MTRKDYELLAKVFAETKPTIEQFTTHSAIGDNTMVNHMGWEIAYASWERTIRALCDALEAENPRFSRSIFQYKATAPITITVPSFNMDGSRKS